MDTVALFALIGALGVGAQWLAWRFNLPAIVLMLAAGLAAGLGLDLIQPERDFGDLLRPIVAVAVAVILFEGGLTLNFRQLRDAAPAVRRLVFLGAPLGWAAATAAGVFAAGLSVPTAAVFGGILVVTGPTVIMPLLRQARLAQRPASILRWEAIVNDPLGALFAVLAFEVIVALGEEGDLAAAGLHLALGITAAGGVGYLAGRGLAMAFRRGMVPEYLKAPLLFTSVLVVYAATDAMLHESGLLAVTIMGVVLGNAKLPSFDEIRRFKEQITVLLVSGVFVILAASLNRDMLALLDWRALAFVAVVMFVARPVATLLALAGTGLPMAEKALLSWIAPRGVVAVAVSGFFGARLVEEGRADGAMLAPLAFALVAATVVAHGFTIGAAARFLGLTSREPPGALIVGGSPFAVALAHAVQEAGAPALIVDRNWRRLSEARLRNAPSYWGEILSETAEHSIDLNRYGTIVAATDNDDYNTLICTDFAPEFGRDAVLQVGRVERGDDGRDLPPTLGGRSFAGGAAHDLLNERVAAGWKFSTTRLTEAYGYEDWAADRGEATTILAWSRGEGALTFASSGRRQEFRAGDRLLSFGPPDAPRGRAE